MTGRVLRPKFVRRADVQAAPEILWCFADNMQRRGLGGQAREMRGEPNAVGVVTKWAPGRAEADYFTDATLGHPGVRTAIEQAFDRLRRHLAAGGTVAIPADGLGTGLAELPTRAPRVHAWIEALVRGLG